MRPRRTASTSSTSHAGEPGFGCSASMADSLQCSASQSAPPCSAERSVGFLPDGLLSNCRPVKGATQDICYSRGRSSCCLTVGNIDKAGGLCLLDEDRWQASHVVYSSLSL